MEQQLITVSLLSLMTPVLLHPASNLVTCFCYNTICFNNYTT